ncbi:MAG TPA: glycosyltransferase family 4 protein [Chloroflexia bacterium]|nr:glycosyltransferase family 4 protein [Chloroflexia bacterium]
MGYKIQMIAPTSFFADTGCHVRILEEIWSLQDAGHDVTVCTYHMGNDIEGVRVKRSLDVPWHKGVQVGSSRHKLYFDAMLTLKSIQVAWQEKPDIIHAHLHEGALIGFPLKWILRRGKAPLIFDYQGSMTSEMLDHHFLRKNGPFYKPAVAIEKLINRMPDRIITSTHNAANVLHKKFNAPDDLVVTISDRVNPTRFRPAETADERAETAKLRRQLGIAPDRKVVVYLGLLAPYQGTNVLLEAAQMLKTEMPEAFFVIMGYPGVESYSRLAESLGLQDRVIFPGRIPYEQAARYLRLGDIAVAPKMSETEGAGKITNYMAMGLPVVCFDTPVSRELLGDLGVYAELGSARALADQIKNLLADEARRHELSRQLRAKAVREMGWDGALRELEEVYRQTLQGKQAKKAASQPSFAADSGRDHPEGEQAWGKPLLHLGVAADSGHDCYKEPEGPEEVKEEIYLGED